MFMECLALVEETNFDVIRIIRGTTTGTVDYGVPGLGERLVFVFTP